MARNTPPTLVSYTETVWTTGAASKSTASVSWQTGDILVVIGGCETTASVTLGTPTATGLTFTSQVAAATSNTCFCRGATAVAASSSSAAVTMTNTSATPHWGFGVWVWRGSDGFDVAGTQSTSTKTKAVTHTDTHSATCWGVFDFAAIATTGITPTPTATHVRQSAKDGTNYTLYVADLADQASSGAVSYGIAGGSGTGPFTIGIIAVLGTTGGGGGSTVKQLAALGVG